MKVSIHKTTQEEWVEEDYFFERAEILEETPELATQHNFNNEENPIVRARMVEVSHKTEGVKSLATQGNFEEEKDWHVRHIILVCNEDLSNGENFESEDNEDVVRTMTSLNPFLATQEEYEQEGCPFMRMRMLEENPSLVNPKNFEEEKDPDVKAFMLSLDPYLI